MVIDSLVVPHLVPLLSHKEDKVQVCNFNIRFNFSICMCYSIIDMNTHTFTEEIKCILLFLMIDSSIKSSR